MHESVDMHVCAGATMPSRGGAHMHACQAVCGPNEAAAATLTLPHCPLAYMSAEAVSLEGRGGCQGSCRAPEGSCGAHRAQGRHVHVDEVHGCVGCGGDGGCDTGNDER